MLGYSGIFKIGATARCEAMGVGEEDAQYLRSIQEALNAMIRTVADAPDQGYSGAAGYVDVYGPSAGHTACDLPRSAGSSRSCPSTPPRRSIRTSAA